MSIAASSRNVWLPAACRGMLLCNGVTLIARQCGLVGRRLAPPTLATPDDHRLRDRRGPHDATGLSQFMGRFGRAGFMLGALLLGICGGLLCAYAVHVRLLAAVPRHLHLGQLQRLRPAVPLAAAAIGPADWKPKAISYTWPAASSAASSAVPSAASRATPGAPSSWPPTRRCRPSRWSRC